MDVDMEDSNQNMDVINTEDSKQKLFYTFLEYENLLYVDKNKFNR